MCFGGRLSRHNPLSNFYEVPFFYNNIKYTSAEQALQHSKALKFGDHTQAQLIINSTECSEQKRFGKHVTNFDLTTWNTDKVDILTGILTAKFSQNLVLKNYLCDTKSRIIGEASMRDDVYGIGFPLHHKDVLDKNKWSGRNELGTVLMSVRNTFKD